MRSLVSWALRTVVVSVLTWAVIGRKGFVFLCNFLLSLLLLKKRFCAIFAHILCSIFQAQSFASDIL